MYVIIGLMVVMCVMCSLIFYSCCVIAGRCSRQEEKVKRECNHDWVVLVNNDTKSMETIKRRTCKKCGEVREVRST